MLLTALISYVAGLLTVLAPCVLPLLPVILGGGLSGEKKDKWRPYVITASLATSLILFTLLLKASTVLIGVDPRVWSIGSGVLVVLLGVFMLFPDLWVKLIAKLGIEHRSQGLLGKAYKNNNNLLSAILIGAALGPIFSSCSPTYAWVIATVLPSSTLLGMVYLSFYVLGVSTSLLAIALLGRRLLVRIKWASDPKGLFQRGIAVLFIIVGVLVASGLDKKIQTYLVDKDFLNIKSLEEKLVPDNEQSTRTNSNTVLNKEEFNLVAYDAPELKGLSDWINSDPQTIAQLKGKVILIDFWTYSCINCIRTQPYLNAWHTKYSDDGLVILGIHAPEFAFERDAQNVKRAVVDAGIEYPVALDNNFATWNNYENRFWPAKYLIDKDGQVRYAHFGEGEYAETEAIIQKLLQETGSPITQKLEGNLASGLPVRGQTPETYLGYDRAERFANANELIAEKAVNYQLASVLAENEWSLGGEWQVNGESSQSLSDNSKLRINYSGKEVYLVMSGPPGSKVGVFVEGIESPGGIDVNGDGNVVIDDARLYKIVNTQSFQTKNILTLTVPAGVTVNAFTFGGQ